MIVSGGKKFAESYEQLGDGDWIVGPIGASFLQPAVLMDLMERKVRFAPSLLSQLLHRSKIAQATVLSRYMSPNTCVVHRRVDLLDTLNRFCSAGIDVVVTKQEHKHCGQGIRKWDDLEQLYNAMALDADCYPFVIQPFLDDIVDVRVIAVHDYIEAYTRANPWNFRKNMAAGGTSRSCVLDPDTEAFCRSVMARGRFPYAHLDLHMTAQGERYLSEISLTGGIKGAKIDRKNLEKKKREQLDRVMTE